MEHEERLRAALADRYTIDRKIGEGGMATVYLAHDLKHDREIAVKVLDPDLAQSLGAERFLREIRTAANLTHPHILPVHDSGEADGFLYYVMPYVKGESLRARLSSEGQLPVEDAVQITREIAGAMAYAHNQGVIHRDIKPANIMLEEGHAVLADFGVAQAVAEAKGDRITRVGSSLGTPEYMSPEQAAGQRSLDGRSDQYALGCVLFEMLAGEPPFTGPTPSAVQARHISGRLPSLAVVRPNLPKGLIAAIEKALAKVPADRYLTASDFSTAVLEGATGEITAVRPRPRIGVGRILATMVVFALALFSADRIMEGCARDGAPGLGLQARIAVTYFNVAGDDPELAALGDGLTEQVADALFGLGTLDVISLNAMLPYKGTGLSLDAIEELDLDAYVEGSVMGTPDRLSVSVQLIDAEDLRHLESQVIEGSAGEPLVILEELAGEVSGLLREWLGVHVELAELQSGTKSGTAWNLVQRGGRRMDYGIQLMESGDTAAAARALMEADQILAMAEEEDPSFITPIVDRGWVAEELARMGTTGASYDTTWTRVGIGHADRAVAKDPNHARALELRGILLECLASETADGSLADALLAEAERDLIRATELDPSRCQAFSYLSRVYERQGRFAEAKVAAEEAYSRDPYQRGALNILFRLCSISMQLEVWADVDRWFGEARERFPDQPYFPSANLAALAGPRGLAADPDLAWKLSDEVIRFLAPHERDQGEPPQLLQVAAVLARAGLSDSARAVMDRALALPEASGPRVYVQEANARLRLGDRDGALDALERFIEASPADRSGLPAHWWWEEIWDHPRFIELADTAGRG